MLCPYIYFYFLSYFLNYFFINFNFLFLRIDSYLLLFYCYFVWNIFLVFLVFFPFLSFSNLFQIFFISFSFCILFLSTFFFSKETKDLEELVKKFIKIGSKVKDPIALQALSVSLAKLSNDNKYLLMLEKHGMLNPLTEQLFVLMEICNVSLYLFYLSMSSCLYHNLYFSLFIATVFTHYIYIIIMFLHIKLIFSWIICMDYL